MTKFFTIAVSGLTADQERRLGELWKPYGWWHWVPNFWLLRDHTGLLTAVSLRDQVKIVDPTCRCIVVEVQPTTWASLVNDPAARDWLRNYWPPEKP